MFSYKLKNLFKDSPLYLSSTLYLPESSYDSIRNVLKSVYSGVTPNLEDFDQQEFQETFQLLGFDKPIDRSGCTVDTIDASKSDNSVYNGIRRAKPNVPMRLKVPVVEEKNSEDDEASPDKSDPLPNGCLCRVFNPFLPTITCKNKSCKIKKFHQVCVNLKTVPRGGWTCEACRKPAVAKYKCEACSYESPGSTRQLMLHYANHHFRSSLVELIDIFFKGNRCFHCEKEVYHNRESQKIIHIGITHGKIKTILNRYGIGLHLKTRNRSGQPKSVAVEKSIDGRDSPADIDCELCKVKFPSNNDLLSHLGFYHFKSEITNLLNHYFLYQGNHCRRCPHLHRAIPGTYAKVIHVGTVHGVTEKLLKEKIEAEKEHLEGKRMETEKEHLEERRMDVEKEQLEGEKLEAVQDKHKNVTEIMRHQLNKQMDKEIPLRRKPKC